MNIQWNWFPDLLVENNPKQVDMSLKSINQRRGQGYSFQRISYLQQWHLYGFVHSSRWEYQLQHCGDSILTLVTWYQQWLVNCEEKWQEHWAAGRMKEKTDYYYCSQNPNCFLPFHMLWTPGPINIIKKDFQMFTSICCVAHNKRQVDLIWGWEWKVNQ